MKYKDDIEKIFEKENLIIPDYNNLNIVNLVQTLFNRYGMNFDVNENICKLDNIIPYNKHTLFVLVDGMGSNLVSSLDDNLLIKKNKKCDLLTVSPSTTGCVLSSVSTGTYPEEHGIIVWYSYNRKYKIDYYPLLFIDRTEEMPLSDYGILPEDIYKTESVFNKLNITTNVLYPEYICDSVYSKNVADCDRRCAYNDYDDVVDIIKNITNNNDKTFTYLYLPNVDTLEHDNGVYSKVVEKEIIKIDAMIKKLAAIEDMTIVVTADHGQININNDIVMDFEKYKKYFYAMPGIDFATTTFYVKKDLEDEFECAFKEDFKDRMYLFKTEDIIKKNIFGLGNVSEYFKSNMGEYIGICKNGYCFVNSENLEEYLGKTFGNHSGFSKDEMIIPLIVINSKDYEM